MYVASFGIPPRVISCCRFFFFLLCGMFSGRFLHEGGSVYVYVPLFPYIDVDYIPHLGISNPFSDLVVFVVSVLVFLSMLVYRFLVLLCPHVGHLYCRLSMSFC